MLQARAYAPDKAKESLHAGHQQLCLTAVFHNRIRSAAIVHLVANPTRLCGSPVHGPVLQVINAQPDRQPAAVGHKLHHLQLHDPKALLGAGAARRLRDLLALYGQRLAGQRPRPSRDDRCAFMHRRRGSCRRLRPCCRRWCSGCHGWRPGLRARQAGVDCIKMGVAAQQAACNCRETWQQAELWLQQFIRAALHPAHAPPQAACASAPVTCTPPAALPKLAPPLPEPRPLAPSLLLAKLQR